METEVLSESGRQVVEVSWGDIRSWFEGRVHELSVPFASLAIAHSGKMYSVEVKGRGRSKYGGAGRGAPLGCLAGILTAQAVTTLADRGQLSLHDSAAQFLADEDQSIVAPLRDVRVGHLLSHTSGVASYPDDAALRRRLGRSEGEAEKIAVGLETLFEPGLLYSYCHLNFILLGQVLRASTGAGWLDAIKDLVLAPLHCEKSLRVGRHNWRLRTDRHSSYEPYDAAWAGHVFLSVEDICRIAAAHVSPPAHFGAMNSIAAQMKNAPDWQPRMGSSAIKGFAWKHMKTGSFGHSGIIPGRTHASLTMSAEKRMAIAMQIFENDGRLYGETLLRFGLLGTSISIESTMQEAAPGSPEGYLGRFRSGRIELEISRRGPDLTLQVFDSENNGKPQRFNKNPIGLRKIKPRVFVGRGAVDDPMIGGPFYVEYLGERDARSLKYLRIRDRVYVADKMVM